MKFLVHVIDDASLHKQIENRKFKIMAGKFKDQQDQECLGHVVRSDAFYSVEAEKPIDAAMGVSGIIKVRSGGEEIPLSKAFVDTNNSLKNADFDSDSPDALLNDTPLTFLSNPYTESLVASCQIKNEDVYELHKVHFFITEWKKVVEIGGFST